MEGEEIGIGAGAGGTDIAPATQDAAPRTPVDLDQFDEFKNYKATVNRTIAERDKSAREAEQRWQRQLQEQSERTRQLEEEMEKRVMAGLDEFGQMEYRASQEARRRKELEQKLSEIEGERSRNEFVRTIQDRYGVEPSDMSHPVMALQSVTDALHQKVQDMEKELARYRKEHEARSAGLNDAPDLGGGAPAAPQSELQRSFNEAMMNMRGADADRISRQAVEQGVTIDRLAFIKMRQQQRANNGA